MAEIPAISTTFNYHPYLKYVLRFAAQYTFKSIPNVTETERKKIKTFIICSFKEGWTTRELSKQIQKIVDDRDKAEIIAITERARIAVEAGLIIDEEEHHIKKVKWHNTQSKFLCDHCRNMNDIQFTIKAAKGVLPAHLNCRCRWRQIVD